MTAAVVRQPLAQQGGLLVRRSRAIAIGSLLLSAIGVLLSLALWAEQRFAPPPVSFMNGPASIASHLPMALAYAVVGTVLASRRPRNAIGWLFLVIGVTTSFVPAVHLMVAAASGTFVATGPFTLLAAWLVSSFHLPLVGALLILVFLVFPDGRAPSRRWWTAAILALGGALAVGGGLATDPRGLLWYPTLPNPFGGPAWASDLSDALQLCGMAGVLAGLAVAGASLVVRYRSCTLTERQPLKWIGLAIALLGVTGAGLMIVRYGIRVDPSVGEMALVAAVVAGTLLPVAAAIGMLRHHLFDIDLILNHALVYVPLSALMTGLYAASVALFQRLFVAVTGNTSDVAIILTTLILATTFTPMRKALEGVVDRHFKPVARSGVDAGPTTPATEAPDQEATAQGILDRVRSLEGRLSELEQGRGRKGGARTGAATRRSGARGAT